MPIRGPHYQTQSALNIVSDVIGRPYREDRDRRDRIMSEGIKGLATAGGQVYSYMKRKSLMYKGDEYLKKLIAEREELLQEKASIENQIRVIQNEDPDYGMSTTTEPFKSAGEGYGPNTVEPYPTPGEELDYTAFEGVV